MKTRRNRQPWIETEKGFVTMGIIVMVLPLAGAVIGAMVAFI